MTLAFQKQYPKVFLIFVLSFFWTISAKADTNADSLPFSQDWSNIALITANDDWSGVPSITGYRGDGLTSLIGADPQTIIAGDDALPVVDVNVNNTTPNTFATGGVTEFHLADPVIALQGSGTADAPYIKIFLDTTNTNQIQVAYDVRDIDGSTDSAIQQVALHYRAGSSGNFTNLAGGYIADATTGPSLTALVTHINVTLPSAADNQSHLELRIMTTNATGNDEWVGVDNISITANHAPTGVGVFPNSVLENKSSGTTVGTLTAADPDPTDTHTFALTNSALCAGNGVDNIYFSLTGNILTTAASFDFETKSSYSICAQVTDNHGLSKTASVQINILDIADETPPSVTIEQASAQPDPTNLSPINFTVVFSEPVTGFDASDMDFSASTVGGTLTAVITEIAAADHTTYNIAVSGMTSNGDVIVGVLAGGAADSTGNVNFISTSTDHQVAFSTDVTPPSVTIDQAASQLDPTNLSPINFTVVFSEPVTGFDASDMDFSASTVGGTLTAAIMEIAPADYTTYNVAVSGMTSNGDVIAGVLAGGAEDSTGNVNFISTSADHQVAFSTDVTPPSVTIEQASAQPDPTNVSPINFMVVFSEPVTNFVTGDVALSGTAGASTAMVTQITGTTYNVTVSGITLDGTVIVNINASIATDAIGNLNMASASTDNQVTFSTDVTPPSVLSSNPASGSVLLTGSTQIIVQFSEEVKNDSSTGAANNAVNFLLVKTGTDLTFETASCLANAAVTDIPIAINAAAYQNKITTLDINGGIPLSAGSYRLFICGTTSIEDLVGNKLNNGADDSHVNFSVSRTLANSKSNWNSNSNLPATGFPVGRVTHLPVQTADKKYAAFSDFWLEIPKLTVSTPIVGVPLTQDGWDVTWLGQKAGWLNETAFPSWVGNSVITAHVWDAYNQPGIFYNLKDLQYGDLIKVHAFGQVYTYEVRETKQIAPNNFSAILKHEDKAWLTLLTCEDYMPRSQTYGHRRMVRAVWVSVASEK